MKLQICLTLLLALTFAFIANAQVTLTGIEYQGKWLSSRACQRSDDTQWIGFFSAL